MPENFAKPPTLDQLREALSQYDQEQAQSAPTPPEAGRGSVIKGGGATPPIGTSPRMSASTQPPEPRQEFRKYPGLLENAGVPRMSDTQKTVTRMALETGAGIAAGSLVGGPLGGAIEGAVGVQRAITAAKAAKGVPQLLRTVAPKAMEKLAEKSPSMIRALNTSPAVGLGEGMGSLLAETVDPSKEPIGRAVTTGLIGATGEAFTPGFARAFEMLRRGGFQLKEGARPFVERMLAAGKRVSPGYFSDNFIIQAMDNVAAGSIFGGATMRKAKEAGAEMAGKEAEAYLKAIRSFASDSLEVEDLTKQMFEGSSDVFRQVARKKFGVIDEISQSGAQVNLKPVIDKLGKEFRTAYGAEATKHFTQEIDRLIELGLIRENLTTSFEMAADLRSAYLLVSRNIPDSTIQNKASSLGKNLAGILDNEMQKSFDTLSASGQPIPQGLKEAWRSANEFYKKGAQVFNSDLIKALSRQQPRALVSAIGNSTRNIRLVRKVLTEGIQDAEEQALTTGGRSGKEVWQTIQGELVNDLAKKSTTLVDGEEVLLGRKMLNSLTKRKDQMTEALGKQGYENAVKIFQEVALAQGEGMRKGLPGRVWIVFKQAGAFSEAAGLILGRVKGLTAETAGLIVGPVAMAKLITKPSWTKWMLLGLNPRTPPEVASRAITQAFAMAIREGAVYRPTEPPEDSPLAVERRARPRAPVPAFLSGPGRAQE